jgi:hypothetical protein
MCFDGESCREPRMGFVRSYSRRSNHEPEQGWLPIESIVYKHEMLRHERVRAQTAIVSVGDYIASYEVDAAGSFKVWQVVSDHTCRKNEVPNEYGACEEFGIVRGAFYGRGHFAISKSKSDGLAEGDVFRLLEDGTLCPKYSDDAPLKCQQ